MIDRIAEARLRPMSDQTPEAPNADEDTRRYAFFAYDGTSPPAGALLDHLRAAVPSGRQAMERLAIAFIEGEPPYAGAFIAHQEALATPLRDFAGIARRLPRSAPAPMAWLGALRLAVSALPGGDLADWLASPAYAAEIDRVWQSCFALAVMRGYRQALLGDLSEALWLDHAIRLGLKLEAGGEIGLATLTAAQSGALARAAMVLPAGIFPLPPALTA